MSLSKVSDSSSKVLTDHCIIKNDSKFNRINFFLLCNPCSCSKACLKDIKEPGGNPII